MSSKKIHIEFDLTDRQINRLKRILNYGIAYSDMHMHTRDTNENDKLVQLIFNKI